MYGHRLYGVEGEGWLLKVGACVVIDLAWVPAIIIPLRAAKKISVLADLLLSVRRNIFLNK